MELSAKHTRVELSFSFAIITLGPTRSVGSGNTLNFYKHLEMQVCSMYCGLLGKLLGEEKWIAE